MTCSLAVDKRVSCRGVNWTTLYKLWLFSVVTRFFCYFGIKAQDGNSQVEHLDQLKAHWTWTCSGNLTPNFIIWGYCFVWYPNSLLSGKTSFAFNLTLWSVGTILFNYGKSQWKSALVCIEIKYIYSFATKPSQLLNWIHSGFLELWCYPESHPAFPQVLIKVIEIKDFYSTEDVALLLFPA